LHESDVPLDEYGGRRRQVIDHFVIVGIADGPTRTSAQHIDDLPGFAPEQRASIR
jgi:hypothetical protein